MENPRIVTEGKGGCYILMSPDFKKCKLDETNELLRPGEVIPFGFEKTIDGYGDSNTHHLRDSAHTSAFKNFIENVIKRAKEEFVPYILVYITYDSYGAANWVIKAKYQLLVKTKK